MNDFIKKFNIMNQSICIIDFFQRYMFRKNCFFSHIISTSITKWLLHNSNMPDPFKKLFFRTAFFEKFL